MNKIKQMLYGVCALIIASFSLAAPSNAGSINLSDPFNVSGGGAAGNMGGPYVAIQGAMYGSTLDGSGNNANGEKLNDASLGKVFGSVGLNIGWTFTPGEDAVMKLSHGATSGWEETYTDQLPLGRLLRPGEIAKTIRFLATDTSYPMTGSVVDFDQISHGVGEWPPPPTKEP